MISKAKIDNLLGNRVALYMWKDLRAAVRQSEFASLAVCIIYRCFDMLVSPVVLVAIFEPMFWLLGMRGGGRLSCAKVQSILIVKTDRFGDLTLATPFLRSLREAFPSARISFFIDSNVVPLVELCPYIDEILPFDQNGWSRNWRWHCFLFNLPASIKLWMRRFDLAIVPTCGTDRGYISAVAYLSGARWRLGYTEKIHAEKAEVNRNFDLFFTDLLQTDAHKHEVERYLFVLESLGFSPSSRELELWLHDSDELFAENKISWINKASRTNDRRDHSGPLIAFCMGASMEKKKWPILRYQELAHWLVKEYDARIVLVGGPGDRMDADQLVQSMPDSIFSIAGNATIRQSAALLKRCDLYVGNDTGPMHLAAASRVPVIAIFANNVSSGKTLRFRPWNTPLRIARPQNALPPCIGNVFGACYEARQHCILQVTVEQAREACEALMVEVQKSSGMPLNDQFQERQDRKLDSIRIRSFVKESGGTQRQEVE
jgi:ADP-heptose:LPS heptosyltransferase